MFRVATRLARILIASIRFRVDALARREVVRLLHQSIVVAAAVAVVTAATASVIAKEVASSILIPALRWPLRWKNKKSPQAPADPVECPLALLF